VPQNGEVKSLFFAENDEEAFCAINKMGRLRRTRIDLQKPKPSWAILVRFFAENCRFLGGRGGSILFLLIYYWGMFLSCTDGKDFE